MIIDRERGGVCCTQLGRFLEGTQPSTNFAALAQLGERETEVLKVLCSIHRSSKFEHI